MEGYGVTERIEMLLEVPRKQGEEKDLSLFLLSTLQPPVSTSHWLNLPEARGQLNLGNLVPCDTEQGRRMAGLG